MSLFFVGCEKYELPSDPSLNLNGRWDVVNIQVVIDKVNYNGDVVVLNSDRASVSSFFVSGVNQNNQLILSQNYNNVLINKRFDVTKTKWEFDGKILKIKDNDPEMSFWVEFPCRYCEEKTTMEMTHQGELVRYTFDVDTYGAMPANKLVLTSQPFYTNVTIGGNQYDKAIISHLEITFHRI